MQTSIRNFLKLSGLASTSLFLSDKVTGNETYLEKSPPSPKALKSIYNEAYKNIRSDLTCAGMQRPK